MNRPRSLTVMLITVLSCLIMSEYSHAADLIVTGPVTISVDTTFDSVVVQSGGILTADGIITVTGNMRIESGGVLTHSLHLLSGLVLNVTDTLDVRSGGSIDLTGKGLYAGGSGLSAFGRDGETFDSAGNIVSGATGSYYSHGVAGASYGGMGSPGSNGHVPNQAYGLLEDAAYLGSGGGGIRTTDMTGGHGGGRATISAGICIVDGTITANGGNGLGTGSRGTGGGSGGGLRLNVSELSGAGLIQAIGGYNPWVPPYGRRGGAGGGGRIAIYYQNMTLPEGNISASGISDNYASSAGTVYLKDSAEAYGDLIVDNGGVSSSRYTPMMTTLVNFKRLSIGDSTRFSVSTPNVDSFSVDMPVQITGASDVVLTSVVATVNNAVGFDVEVLGGSALHLQGSTSLIADKVRVNGNGTVLNTHIDMSFPNVSDLELSDSASINVDSSSTFSVGDFGPGNFQSGTFTFAANCTLLVVSDSVEIGPGMTLVKDGLFGYTNEIGKLVVDSGGVLTHSLHLLSGLVLNVTDTLDVRSWGAIDLTGKGLYGGEFGSGLSPFGNTGETFDSAGNIVAGATGYPGNNAQTGVAGASYGGMGSSGTQGYTPNAAYGHLEDAAYLGSGGGGTGSPGGHGGGRATIVAGTFIVNGICRANGGNGAFNNNQAAGGGSGGAIHLSVGELTGSGVIQTIGGIGGWWPGYNHGGCGGGGRIAIYYRSMTLPADSVFVGGGANDYNGSAGTVYLKDSADVNGTLIVDNANVNSGLNTPLLTDLPPTYDILIRNMGHLGFEDAFTMLGGMTQVYTNSTLSGVNTLHWAGGTLELNGGSVSLADTLYLDGATLTGSGAISGNVVNASTVGPGFSAGQLTITGDYIQTASGSMAMEFGGTIPETEFDRLPISGTAQLDGHLDATLINGFIPDVGVPLQFMTFASSTGDFATLNLVGDSLYLMHDPNGISLVKTVDATQNSTTEPFVMLSPAGNAPFEVILRDDFGDPIVGSVDIWLDFSGVTGLVPCPIETQWPLVEPDGPSDSTGRITISPNAGGCSSDSVTIMTIAGSLGKVPIRSLDRDGSLEVTALDFDDSSLCCDYDNNGIVDHHDFEIFSLYLGQTCVDVPSNYTTLDVYTIPGPDGLCQGTTIQVCAQITNVLPRTILVDSVVFTTAGWGIANPWSEFSRQVAFTLGPLDTLTVCDSFFIPEVQHGCFRAYIYSRFATDPPGSATIRSKQINRDARRRPGCPTLFTGGGPQSAVNGESRESAFALDYVETQIPVGTESGGTLNLVVQSFLPDGWTYTLSDTNSIIAPDTITVRIDHGSPLACSDSGMVIIYAYTPSGEYAGNAELWAYAPMLTWNRDQDGDGFGNPLDSLVDCNQPTGYVYDSTDCNDADSLINPETVWYEDTDGDGFGTAGTALIQCEQPLGYVLDSTDCNDADSLINPATIWYEDSDNDGYGNPSVNLTQCIQPGGYVLDSTDCNDADENINPTTAWYHDSDGDSFGDPADLLIQCVQPPDYVLDSTDCNDADSLINPNTVWYLDVDGDGYGVPDTSLVQCEQPLGFVLDSTDCNDTDSLINPATVWYQDSDNDSYGNPDSSLVQCVQPAGYILDSADCNDNDSLINPETVWYQDADGDGFGDATSTTISCVQPVGYVLDSTDNCPTVSNPDQADTDGDGIGDACCCVGLRADTDGSGSVDVADLTFLVDYLFRGGSAPGCPNEADIDANGDTNVADLTYLVDYLFAGGPAPSDCSVIATAIPQSPAGNR